MLELEEVLEREAEGKSSKGRLWWWWLPAPDTTPLYTKEEEACCCCCWRYRWLSWWLMKAGLEGGGGWGYC